jgi:hypothetical protein
MIGFRSLCALLIAAFLLPPPAASEPERRFRMYRNPPKPKLVVLPVAGRLEPPVRDLLNESFARESRKLKGYQVVSLPESLSVDSLGQLPRGGLALLHRKHGVDLVLASLLEQGAEGGILSVEIVDARTAGVRADFRQECRCKPEELAARLVPESLRRLTGSPRLRGMQCLEGMAPIPASEPKADTATGSAEGGWGPGSFCIDLYEYPNRPAGEPVVEKTWEQAEALCAKEGKRLCTEAEWELACAGWQAQEFPYGGAYQEGRCNTGSLTIQLSGGNSECKSPFGVFDLSGNVYEWTASKWSAKYRRAKVVKGGNWNAGAENSSCKARFGQPPATVSKAIGFRCCHTLDR